MRIVLARSGAIVCLLALCGCGRSEPPPPAQNTPAARPQEGEPTRLEARPAPSATAPGEAGVSSEFRDRASDALQFIGENLGRGVRRDNRAQFDSDLATAREKVKAARALASTDADKNAALVLTLLFVKDQQRYQTILKTRRGSATYESAQSTIQQLSAGREGCARELRRWLGISDATGGTSRSDACLAEAKTSAAVADLK